MEERKEIPTQRCGFLVFFNGSQIRKPLADEDFVVTIPEIEIPLYAWF